MTARHMLHPGVRAAVESGIGGYVGSRLEAAVTVAGVGPLAIKYGDARFAETVRRTRQLHISSTLGFTWGTGVYCATVHNPLSTAIYGRVGSVARFDPRNWTIFDATQPANQAAYIGWLQTQPLYPLLALTVHAMLANQLMRDHFRQTFRIDCIVFHPDQADTSGQGGFGAVYTRPDDLWMCVGDFGAGSTLLRGTSPSLYDAWPCVLLEEQFAPQLEGMVYAPEIGPLGGTPAGVTLARAVAAAHAAHTWLKVPA